MAILPTFVNLFIFCTSSIYCLFMEWYVYNSSSWDKFVHSFDTTCRYIVSIKYQMFTNEFILCFLESSNHSCFVFSSSTWIYLWKRLITMSVHSHLNSKSPGTLSKIPHWGNIHDENVQKKKKKKKKKKKSYSHVIIRFTILPKGCFTLHFFFQWTLTLKLSSTHYNKPTTLIFSSVRRWQLRTNWQYKTLETKKWYNKN